MAGIVTDVWHDEASRDPAGEAERVMNLLGVKPALAVADIGAGSGYYTVRLARRLGRTEHVLRGRLSPDQVPRSAGRHPPRGLRAAEPRIGPGVAGRNLALCAPTLAPEVGTQG